MSERESEYKRNRFAGNQNFINNSQTLTIGPAQGCGLIIIGKQNSAPIIDLYLTTK